MSTATRRRESATGLTLERAVLLALALHVLFGAMVTWWPGLLLAELPPASEARPLEFRFVDTPDSEAPEVPDTEVLSDRDRVAADASLRDDRDVAYAEGNTPEAVMRAPEATQPSPESVPQPEVQPNVAAESTTAQPEEQPLPSSGEAEATPAEVPTNEPAENVPPVPPQPNRLRSSLVQLESFVDPMRYDNREGGAPDSQSLAQFDTRGYDLGPYLRMVLRTIESNWRANIPPLIRTGAGGATFVQLSIRRQRQADGTEVAVIVAERTWTSGQPAYDTAALFSLELSSPLPPIPDYYPHETIDGRLGYLYNLDPDRVVFPER